MARSYTRLVPPPLPRSFVGLDQESKSYSPPEETSLIAAHKEPEPKGKRPSFFCSWRTCELWAGIISLVLGVIILILGCVGRKPLNEFRAHKLKENLVVDSAQNPNYEAWVTNSAVKTPVISTFYFFNLTNPDEFLDGMKPVVDEVGPYDFETRTRKYNVTFIADGNLVSYVTLQQAEYRGDPARLDDVINFLNIPYIAGAATVGGESNLLRAGSQQALTTMRHELSNTFIPTLRENAVVTAITKSLAAINGLNSLVGGSVEKRWGGGCATYLFIKRCGFDDLSDIMGFLSPLDMSLELAKKAINPQLDAPGLTLSAPTVKKLWNKKDKLSMLNVDRDEKNSSIRYGVSYWLWGNETIQEQITQRFKITDKQFSHLRSYLLDLYHNSLLWDNVYKTYLNSLSKDEAKQAKVEVKQWDDLIWRQWLRSDVISGLQNKANLESVQPDSPPEWYWYQKELKGPLAHRLWTKKQAICLFDVAERSSQYFQVQVLQLPSSSSLRPQFLDEQLPTRAEGENGDKVKGDKDIDKKTLALPEITSCLKDEVDRELLDGYLTYVAKNLVEKEFQKRVLDANGGLISARTVSELILGHQAPILQQLPSDDPRAKLFSLAVNDKSLHGPAYCESVADVDNPYSACTLVGATSDANGRTVSRVFAKVPHTYHTGKDDTRKTGAFQAFHGDTVAWGIWPDGNLTIEGAVDKEQGSVQFGYSDGMSFPPFGATNHAQNIFLLVPQFVLGLKLQSVGEVKSRGINLRRYALAPDTFSSTRSDASLFSMAPSSPEGLLNITGVYTAPIFLSKPHYRGTDGELFKDVGGLKEFDKDRDESYLDVEPITGKTMNARIQLQLSVSTRTNLFGEFYPNVYQTDVIPVFSFIQRAELGEEDAHFFVSQVYNTESLIRKATTGATVVGALLAVLGCVMAGHILYTLRSRKHGRAQAQGRVLEDV